MDKRVLVTACGTAASTTIIHELKNHYENLCIIGSDINKAEYIVSSKDVDEFYTFPSVVKDRNIYLDFLLKFCREKCIHYIFAIIDEEVFLLSENRFLFNELGVRLCLPDQNTVKVCHLKNIFSQWISMNIPEIWIRTYPTIDDVTSYPIFVKPTEGRASNGCRIINSRGEYDEYFSTNDTSDYIVQELCEGRIISVDISRDRNTGIVNLCQREEILRNSNGCGIAVEIINDYRLNIICEELVSKLDLNGVVNAEFFVTGYQYKIIEINPRFPAGTSYSCMAGVNIVSDAFEIANEQPIVKSTPTIGKRYARRYETYEM